MVYTYSEISALRWLMGKNLDEDLNIQALEDFFKDPEKYFQDQRVIDFARAFLCPDDNKFKMIRRSECEIRRKLQEIYDRLWYCEYLRAESKVIQGISTFEDKFWKLILEKKQYMEQVYGKENLVIKNYHDWLITLGQYYALCWVIGYKWEFTDYIEEIQANFELTEITTKNNRCIMLRCLVDKKTQLPTIIKKLKTSLCKKAY